MRRIARFRLGSHNLAVELARHLPGEPVAWADRVCTRCPPDTHAVDDEHHLIFECQSVANSRASLPSDLIGHANVRRFMDGDLHVVYKYISECMKTVDDASGQHRAT